MNQHEKFARDNAGLLCSTNAQVNITNGRVVGCYNGYQGNPSNAPFDRILIENLNDPACSSFMWFKDLVAIGNGIMVVDAATLVGIIYEYRDTTKIMIKPGQALLKKAEVTPPTQSSHRVAFDFADANLGCVCTHPKYPGVEFKVVGNQFSSVLLESSVGDFNDQTLMNMYYESPTGNERCLVDPSTFKHTINCWEPHDLTIIRRPSGSVMVGAFKKPKRVIPPWPHKCTSCGAPALHLGTGVDCSSTSCKNWKMGRPDQVQLGTGLDLMGFPTNMLGIKR